MFQKGPADGSVKSTVECAPENKFKKDKKCCATAAGREESTKSWTCGT